eukprot:NODE_1167_length_1919_cov_0.221978.p1 type:complete len:279 gc:universal NODE_1167_length_1919_cov_0.221978:896-1732(+)
MYNNMIYLILVFAMPLMKLIRGKKSTTPKKTLSALILELVDLVKQKPMPTLELNAIKMQIITIEGDRSKLYAIDANDQKLGDALEHLSAFQKKTLISMLTRTEQHQLNEIELSFNANLEFFKLELLETMIHNPSNIQEYESRITKLYQDRSRILNCVIRGQKYILGDHSTNRQNWVLNQQKLSKLRKSADGNIREAFDNALNNIQLSGEAANAVATTDTASLEMDPKKFKEIQYLKDPFKFDSTVTSLASSSDEFTLDTIKGSESPTPKMESGRPHLV